MSVVELDVRSVLVESKEEGKEGEGEKERLSHIITFDIENISYVL